MILTTFLLSFKKYQQSVQTDTSYYNELRMHRTIDSVANTISHDTIRYGTLQ